MGKCRGTAVGQLRRCISLMFILLAASGCDPSSVDTSAQVYQSVALDDQEDEVCGMLVREQSAPRGQVVHRDGTRFFFCSLGDMLVHLRAPSPHGRTDAVFVEVMTSEEDPAQSHTEDHPWVPAADAIYVVGIERQRIMGKPVLAYANRREAELAMRGHEGAQILDLVALKKWWQSLTR